MNDNKQFIIKKLVKNIPLMQIQHKVWTVKMWTFKNHDIMTFDLSLSWIIHNSFS